METAQVDVRKLQMLNDRINQTIDALNQVRLSVHGMSHTGIPSVGNQYGSTGYPVVPNAFGANYGTNYGTNSPIGFGHTAGFPVNAQGWNGVQNTLQNTINNPFLSQLWGATQQYLPQTQFGQTPFGQNGFAHTGAETLDPTFVRRAMGLNSTIDPFAATRLAQTFPFVQWGYSPFASGSSPFVSGMY